jgi:hypothetical protein
MHNQHRSPDPTKIERATATSTVALFFYFSTALHTGLPMLTQATPWAETQNGLLTKLSTAPDELCDPGYFRKLRFWRC